MLISNSIPVTDLCVTRLREWPVSTHTVILTSLQNGSGDFNGISSSASGLCKALCAQNIIINSHHVAMEVHKQYLSCYTAVDSGASSHFYPIDYTGEEHGPTANPIHVSCANKAVMVSLSEDITKFNSLPLAAKKCHKFKEIWLPLLSVPQLCKSKLTVTFKGEAFEISDSDGNILITGFLDPEKDLFVISIDNDAKGQRVKEPVGFAGATSYWIETDYNVIVRPILLTSKQHTMANAYSISNVPALISYPHACVGFPVIVTWIHAINKK